MIGSCTHGVPYGEECRKCDKAADRSDPDEVRACLQMLSEKAGKPLSDSQTRKIAGTCLEGGDWRARADYYLKI